MGRSLDVKTLLSPLQDTYWCDISCLKHSMCSHPWSDGEHKAQCSTQEWAPPGYQEPWGHIPDTSQREVHGRKTLSLQTRQDYSKGEYILCSLFQPLASLDYLLEVKHAMGSFRQDREDL